MELRSRSQNTSPIQDLFSLVGWGEGEDEEAGAILKVREALGIFYIENSIKSVRQEPVAGLEHGLSL